jgi:hypothetical protein
MEMRERTLLGEGVKVSDQAKVQAGEAMSDPVDRAAADTAVEVTPDASTLLRDKGKRLLIETNEQGLNLRVVCALCRGENVTAYFGPSGTVGEVRPCSMCGGSDV